MALAEAKQWLDSSLATVAARYDVPGMAVGVLVGDSVVESAAGVLSLNTGVEATPESVFQVGSITKIWTSTLVMQLVDEGLLSLDEPVRSALPSFAVVSESASASVTPRQLLDHTSGFEGDIFTETNKGTDAVELFVDKVLPDVPQLFPAGSMFSYNNAGYSVLGRIVEVLRDKPYTQALRDHLIVPLGLEHIATLPEEALLFRAAVGHFKPEPTAKLTAAPVWNLPYTTAPAGSMLAMSPRSLLTFAQLHLRGGVAASGARVLSEASVLAMQEVQLQIPNTAPSQGQGLGWRITELPGGRVVHHDGNTIGQSAFLRLVPSANAAVCVLTNTDVAALIFHEVAGRLLEEVAGVSLPALDAPPSAPVAVEPRRYVGRYEARVASYEVGATDDGTLWFSQRPCGEFAALFTGEPEQYRLATADGVRFVTVEPVEGQHQSIAFSGDDDAGRATFLHTGRAVARVS
ncbi:serine hydrolase domain-containing protein [Tenggerimyces flavus]|uniref:Serine hydrolase domain-containing protein n=1 Tax=Tenggerimyces flavus TaxID=1708749 RepID=A0ABV7YP57_9ACTN|nr:serine hydrolase domain-containing protein [Tenggerimyces flavus]MBM7784664.1 CubicO group peptidase (beta-lactamase class C family) [Tenggerimyces flavus]